MTTRPAVTGRGASVGAARQKVQAAEDGWDTRDPIRVAQAYTEDTVWRNRDEFLPGRDEVVAFLTGKRERELDYALRKELWAFTDDRIAVRFQYEWHDAEGRTWRSYGNENGGFAPDGLCAAGRPASTTSGSSPPIAGSAAPGTTATRLRCRCGEDGAGQASWSPCRRRRSTWCPSVTSA